MNKVSVFKLSCPNCGAPLSVDLHNDVVLCHYCNTNVMVDSFDFRMDEIRLERERIKNERMQAEAAVDVKFRQQRKGVVIAMAIILFVAALIAVAGIFISANVRSNNNTASETSQVSKQNYTMITDIKDVPAVRLKSIEKKCIENLNNKYKSLNSYTKVSEEIEGHYLACQKDTNYIITVVKTTYHNKDGELVLYSPCRSDNIFLNADGQSELWGSRTYCKVLGMSNHYGLDYLHGYTSMEDLYFDTIESNEKVTSVTATGSVTLYQSSR